MAVVECCCDVTDEEDADDELKRFAPDCGVGQHVELGLLRRRFRCRDVEVARDSSECVHKSWPSMEILRSGTKTQSTMFRAMSSVRFFVHRDRPDCKQGILCFVATSWPAAMHRKPASGDSNYESCFVL